MPHESQTNSAVDESIHLAIDIAVQDMEFTSDLPRAMIHGMAALIHAQNPNPPQDAWEAIQETEDRILAGVTEVVS